MSGCVASLWPEDPIRSVRARTVYITGDAESIARYQLPPGTASEF